MLKLILIALSLLVFSSTAISDELPATTDELVPDGSFTVNAAGFGVPIDVSISSFDSFESEFTDELVAFGFPAEFMADYFSDYSFAVVIIDPDLGTFDICGTSSSGGMYHCHPGSNAESFGCPTGYTFSSAENTCRLDSPSAFDWVNDLSAGNIIAAILVIAMLIYIVNASVSFARFILNFIRN